MLCYYTKRLVTAAKYKRDSSTTNFSVWLMEECMGLSYFDLAENDYQYFKENYSRGRFGNAFCFNSQLICERYLKYLLMPCVQQAEIVGVHSLRKLHSLMREYLSDFKCDWSVVLRGDGFYFNTTYPGDDTFLTTKEDTDDCWAAVEETRRAVIAYVSVHDVPNNSLAADALQTIKGF